MIKWRGRGHGWRSKPWFPPEMSVIIAAIAAMRHLDMDKARFLAPELWGMRTSVITVRHCWKGYKPCRHLVWITLYLFWEWETHWIIWIESNRCCWVISISKLQGAGALGCAAGGWHERQRGGENKNPLIDPKKTPMAGTLYSNRKIWRFFGAFSWGSLEHQLETWWENLGKPRSLGHDFWRVFVHQALSWQATYAVALGALGERQTFEVGIRRPW